MDRSFVLQSSSLGSRHKSAGYFSEGKMWRWAASGSNRLVNITTPTCLRHYTSPPEETPFHVITAASAILFRPSVFALASPTCRPSRSGGNNISIFRQPMLSSHFYTRFPARRSPAHSSSSFPRNVRSACTRLANASCDSLADTLSDRQYEIMKRHCQPH